MHIASFHVSGELKITGSIMWDPGSGVAEVYSIAN